MTEALQVCCAIIEQNGLVLAAQRAAHMRLPLKWEFPGGKIEPPETAALALQREIREEMGVFIEPIHALAPHPFERGSDQPIMLWPFIARIQSGTILLSEHAQTKWCNAQQLLELDWAAADLPVLHSYLRLRQTS